MANTNVMENVKWAAAILEDNMGGYTQEERKTYLEDVRAYGCGSGAVSGVIYYTETEALFKEHMTDILERISDYEEDAGYNPLARIADDGKTNTLYNELVWYVVELTAQDMLEDLEQAE